MTMTAWLKLATFGRKRRLPESWVSRSIAFGAFCCSAASTASCRAGARRVAGANTPFDEPAQRIGGIARLAGFAQRLGLEKQAVLPEAGRFFSELESLEGFGVVPLEKEGLGQKKLHLRHQPGIWKSLEQFRQLLRRFVVLLVVEIGRAESVIHAVQRVQDRRIFRILGRIQVVLKRADRLRVVTALQRPLRRVVQPPEGTRLGHAWAPP